MGLAKLFVLEVNLLNIEEACVELPKENPSCLVKLLVNVDFEMEDSENF